MFASSCRLGLGIAVGPQKPSDIETILSGSLPIFIDYRNMGGDINGSALSTLWRMRAALKHHDRVREISFEVSSANFDEFFRATSFPFPVLKRLDIFFFPETKQKFQTHSSGDRIYHLYIYDVSDCATIPLHSHPDFYRPQQLSPTSI
jgi:hypothetical protein